MHIHITGQFACLSGRNYHWRLFSSNYISPSCKCNLLARTTVTRTAKKQQLSPSPQVAYTRCLQQVDDSNDHRIIDKGKGSKRRERGLEKEKAVVVGVSRSESQAEGERGDLKSSPVNKILEEQVKEMESTYLYTSMPVLHSPMDRQGAYDQHTPDTLDLSIWKISKHWANCTLYCLTDESFRRHELCIFLLLPISSSVLLAGHTDDDEEGWGDGRERGWRLQIITLLAMGRGRWPLGSHLPTMITEGWCQACTHLRMKHTSTHGHCQYKESLICYYNQEAAIGGHILENAEKQQHSIVQIHIHFYPRLHVPLSPSSLILIALIDLNTRKSKDGEKNKDRRRHLRTIV